LLSPYPSPSQSDLRRTASMNLQNHTNSQAESKDETQDERRKRLQNDLLEIEIEERHLELQRKQQELGN
jgi:hypothetical protein